MPHVPGESSFTDATNPDRKVRIAPTGERRLVYVEVDDKPGHQEIRIGGHIQPAELYRAAKMIGRYYGADDLPDLDASQLAVQQVRDIMLGPWNGRGPSMLAAIAEAVGLEVERDKHNRPIDVRPLAGNHVTGNVTGSVTQISGTYHGNIDMRDI